MSTACDMPQAQPPSTSALAVGTHQADPDFSAIPCPFCASAHTRVLSLFGGNAGELLMQCGECHTAFHWIKWQGKLPPHPRLPGTA